MTERLQIRLTRGVLLATACLAVSIAQAASDAPASPPSGLAPQAAPANPSAASPKPEERGARWRADRVAFFEARLAALHAGLQLKPDQDTLWPPVESAIRGFAKLRADRWAARREEDKTKDAAGASATVLDRMRLRSEGLIARGQAMKTLADAAGPLMASLDADQKGRLPRLLDGLRPRRGLGEAMEGNDRGRGGGEREGWRGMRHERMERFGMRDREMGGGHDDYGEGRGFDRGDR